MHSTLIRSASAYSADFEEYEDDFDAYSDSNDSIKQDLKDECSVNLESNIETNDSSCSFFLTSIREAPRITERVMRLKKMISFEYVSMDLLNIPPISTKTQKLRESLQNPLGYPLKFHQQETQTGDGLADAIVQTDFIDVSSKGVQHLEEATSIISLGGKRKKKIALFNEDSPRFQIFLKASAMTCEKLMFEKYREIEEILDTQKILSLKHIIPIPADYSLAVVELSPVHPKIIAVAYHLKLESYIHILHTQWPETPQHVLKCFGNVSCVCPFPTKALSHLVFVGTTDGSFFIFDVTQSTCPSFAANPVLNEQKEIGHLSPIQSISVQEDFIRTFDAQGGLIHWHFQSPMECLPISKTQMNLYDKVVWLGSVHGDTTVYCGATTSLYQSTTSEQRLALHLGHGCALSVACFDSQLLLGYDSGFIALFCLHKVAPVMQWYLGLEKILHLSWLHEGASSFNSNKAFRFCFVSNVRICICEVDAGYQLEIIKFEKIPETSLHTFLFDRLFLAENRRVLSVYQLL